jgi:hypothetical protein
MSLTTHQIRLIRRWHIWVGLFAVVFLLFLVITGFMLNHSDTLGLEKPQVKLKWLMRWYGLKGETPTQAYTCGHNLLAWANGKWALGQALLGADLPQPLGAEEAGGVCYIATTNGLYLFLPDGRLVEKISGKSLPGEPLQALGIRTKCIALKTAAGIYFSDDGTSWRSENGGNVNWAMRQALTPELQRQFSDTLAPSLPLQKVLQDFHGGRIFGRYGPLFMDFIGLCLMGLGLSGTWMFWRSLWLKRTLHRNKGL